MVKPDVKHNYYSDLELPATASVDDIRKAYRKLALQYHPDRNAGREAECVPRFQAIQAANEVLSDPGIKAKYDQDRQRAGINLSSFASAGQTGNPYKATSAYPPPPRRTQPGTWQRPNPATGPGQGAPTGAERFTNFPRPASHAAPKNPAAGRSQAWQNMGGAPSSGTPPRRQPPPMPPRQEKNPQARTRPTMPTEEKIRANFRNMAPPDPDLASAWQHRRANMAQEGPPKDSGAGLGRSNTQRTPRRTGGFDPSAPGSDERPAPAAGSRYSHRHRSEDFTSPRSEFPPPPPGPPPAADPESPMAASSQRPFNATSPLRPPFRSRTTDEHDVPYSEANRTSTPYSSGKTFVGEKTQFDAPMYRSASSKDTTRLNPESARSARARSISPSSKLQPNGSRPKVFVHYSSSDESSEEKPFPSPDSANEPSNPSPAGSSRDRPKKTPAPPSRRFNDTPQADGASPDPRSAEEMPSMQQRQSGTNIFTGPFGHTSSAATTSKSRSEENINTNFSPGGWSGPFTGSNEYFPPPPPPPPPTVSRKGSPMRKGTQRNPARVVASERPPGSINSQDSAPPRSGSDGDQNVRVSPTNTTFNHEDWAQKFKDANWAFPPPPPNPPRSAQRQEAEGAYNGSKGTADSVNEPGGEDKSGDTANINKSATVEDDFDAMEIDAQPPSHPPQGKSSVESHTRRARPVSVPLPKWRQEADKTGHERPTSSGSNSQQPEESDLKVNLNDLLTSQPIGRGIDDGLHSLADLSSTLPFSSQPSTHMPHQDMEPQVLETPPVPQAPEPPARMTKMTWRIHAQNFGRYLEAYHAFNRTMITHFDAREKQSEARMLGGTSWLEAIGDGSGLAGGFSGFGSYWKGVQEDEAVRETWRIGCERHYAAVQKFASLREQVKRQVTANSMPDI